MVVEYEMLFFSILLLLHLLLLLLWLVHLRVEADQLVVKVGVLHRGLVAVKHQLLNERQTSE